MFPGRAFHSYVVWNFVRNIHVCIRPKALLHLQKINNRLFLKHFRVSGCNFYCNFSVFSAISSLLYCPSVRVSFLHFHCSIFVMNKRRLYIAFSS